MKKAFTLIEVIISTILLSLVLIGLYSVLDTQRRSVKVIKKHLDRSIEQDRVVMVLYNDIIKSDGNITIIKNDRDTICMNATTNSLYGLDIAKVCWLVLKDKDTLARVEGNKYRLPLGLEDSVEVDKVVKNVKLFDVTRDKENNILVVLQEGNNEPYSFLLQGIKKPPKPPKKKKPKKKPKPKKAPNKKDGNKTDVNKTKVVPPKPPSLF